MLLGGGTAQESHATGWRHGSGEPCYWVAARLGRTMLLGCGRKIVLRHEAADQLIQRVLGRVQVFPEPLDQPA
jgi:hypothetical protein